MSNIFLLKTLFLSFCFFVFIYLYYFTFIFLLKKIMSLVIIYFELLSDDMRILRRKNENR